MKDQFDLKVFPDGSMVGIYQDGLAEAVGAETKEVKRASIVEWEDIGVAQGWSVRAAHNPKRAIRMTYKLVLEVTENDEAPAVFSSREMALEHEEKFFWELLGPQ
jgi:hypothetical protein